jgi:hypothetical protein
MNNDLKKIEIKFGELELFVSGVFLASAEKESALELFYKDDSLKIILVFDNSDPSKGLTNKGEVIDSRTLKVILYNHTNSLGTHTTKPFYIGGIGNRKLYWYYRVAQLSSKKDVSDAETILEIAYSFYLGSEGPLGTDK